MNNLVPIIIKNDNQCIQCNSAMIFANNIRYCQICKDCPIVIEEELKVVPKNYTPNHLQTKLTAFLKIQDHLRDFLNRLTIPESKSNINELIETVMMLHKSRGEKRKGYREESAAIVYCRYENEHKLSIRRFCQKNNVEVKKFNKMYLLYKKMEKKIESKNREVEKQVQERKEEESNVKVEDDSLIVKREELQPNQQSLYELNLKEEAKERIIEVAVEKIYDKVFDRCYFQTIKGNFMKSLIAKIVKMDSQIAGKEEFRYVKQYYKIPCTIFGVIKANGYSISMKKYIEIAERVLKVEIKQKLLGRYHNVIKEVVKKWQSQEQTISEENVTGWIN